MVGTAAISDPTVQILSERLSPECLLFPKAAVQTGKISLFLGSANGQKRPLTARTSDESLLSLNPFPAFAVVTGDL